MRTLRDTLRDADPLRHEPTSVKASAIVFVFVE